MSQRVSYRVYKIACRVRPACVTCSACVLLPCGRPQLISKPDHIAALRAAYDAVTQSKAEFLSSLECFKACTPDNITQASARGRLLLHPPQMPENVGLGFGVVHDDWKQLVEHGFVHSGTNLRHLRWMREQTSVSTELMHHHHGLSCAVLEIHLRSLTPRPFLRARVRRTDGTLRAACSFRDGRARIQQRRRGPLRLSSYHHNHTLCLSSADRPLFLTRITTRCDDRVQTCP